MIDSPFNSPAFKDTWKKYFAQGRVFENLQFIKPVELLRLRKGLYVNVGKNISNGYGYSIDRAASDYSKKVIVLYDVLPYRMPDEAPRQDGVARLATSQHYGYLARLCEGANLEDFLAKRFSKSSRLKIRKYPKKLSESFETKVEFFDGQISKETYNHLFNSMIHLIGDRFGELGIENNVLKKKDYYYELIYGMVNAGLGVIQRITCDDEVAAIGVCFRSERQMYYAITTFDTSLRKYNVGHVLIYNWIEWCYKNQIDIFDFSKGQNEYKRRWANEEYRFENHILYDQASLFCAVEARLLYWYFGLKQTLRDYRFNRFYSKLKYYTHLKRKTSQEHYQASPVTEYDLSLYELISAEHPDYQKLKGVLYDLLFPSAFKARDMQLYKKKRGKDYLLLGLETVYRLTHE